jgi:hypothetical protein
MIIIKIVYQRISKNFFHFPTILVASSQSWSKIFFHIQACIENYWGFFNQDYRFTGTGAMGQKDTRGQQKKIVPNLGAAANIFYRIASLSPILGPIGARTE